MKCDVIHDLLSCYIDNTCSEETRRLVDEHLKECEECRQLYEELSNVKFEFQADINENKPFVKVKRNFLKKLIIVLCTSALIFIFAGSTITGTIVKERMKWYVKENYSHLNLEMTSFSYRDPSAQGFGVNNAYYYAEYTDPNQKDMNFAVFTEGFFLKITDNYDYQINQKYSIIWRLTDDYTYDVSSLLKREIGDVFVSCGVGLGDESGYDYSGLVINQNYERSIDKLMPISLHIELKNQGSQSANEDVVKKIVGILKDNGFSTPYLTTTFIDDGGYSYNHVPEIKNLDY